MGGVVAADVMGWRLVTIVPRSHLIWRRMTRMSSVLLLLLLLLMARFLLMSGAWEIIPCPAPIFLKERSAMSLVAATTWTSTSAAARRTCAQRRGARIRTWMRGAS